MHLLERPVGLHPVVRAARRHGVEPAVAAAERTREQVVDRVAASTARRAIDHELIGVDVAQANSTG